MAHTIEAHIFARNFTRTDKQCTNYCSNDTLKCNNLLVKFIFYFIFFSFWAFFFIIFPMTRSVCSVGALILTLRIVRDNYLEHGQRENENEMVRSNLKFSAWTIGVGHISHVSCAHLLARNVRNLVRRPSELF